MQVQKKKVDSFRVVSNRAAEEDLLFLTATMFLMLLEQVIFKWYLLI